MAVNRGNPEGGPSVPLVEPTVPAGSPRHWENVARHWRQLGPPLRPTAQDVAFYADAINEWAKSHGVPRALILGVTPELYSLPWPAGSNVMAADQTQDMIDAVWPGPRNAVVRADWKALPLAASSRDVVLCDGGLQLVAYPHGLQNLATCLRRVIAPEGICIFRLFIPPQVRESPELVLNELLAGRIASLNHLKLRLGMALHEDAHDGVGLRQVWDALHDVAPDLESLAARVGWPLEHLLAINTYRDRQTRYYFLKLSELRENFCQEPGGFELEQTYWPTYELGERCPMVVLRRMAPSPS
jgi:SAM-dependent methyltransferase